MTTPPTMTPMTHGGVDMGSEAAPGPIGGEGGVGGEAGTDEVTAKKEATGLATEANAW